MYSCILDAVSASAYKSASLLVSLISTRHKKNPLLQAILSFEYQNIATLVIQLTGMLVSSLGCHGGDLVETDNSN